MSGIGGFDIYAVMSEALGCLCEGLAETPAGRPCRCTLAVGTNLIPVDACACEGPDCGMAWVRLDAAFPSSTFP
ncbi:MAG: hypothetical protein FWG11_08735, partial [Promicromonosporaceae bacterium]|nr:hypothetical protein [Promicromonosporaceae bacterium]